ncbi:MAG: polyphosphate polymerase domain-containing protein [Rikenellaceae bacterium]
MNIGEVIYNFEGISLSEMDAVKLMNRTDRKYWFSRELLADILEDVSQEYYILEVDGDRNLPYSTVYYDTDSDEMYNNHHRGKKNRYKVRRRNYVSTNTSFLEVKFKSNKGRTVKVRRPSSFQEVDFDAMDRAFIDRNCPYRCDDLRRVLENGFRRLMLVSKAMNERCTIDSELRFISDGGEARLDNLVIVEVKSDGRSHSAIIDALNRRRLRPSGFSKYCMGRSLTNMQLRHNNFKAKHREILKRSGSL